MLLVLAAWVMLPWLTPEYCGCTVVPQDRYGSHYGKKDSRSCIGSVEI
jgi:hypothetical protein